MCKIPCIRPTDLPKLSSSAGRVDSPSTIRGLRAPGDMGLTGDTGPDTGLMGCGDCTGSDPAPGDMGIPPAEPPVNAPKSAAACAWCWGWYSCIVAAGSCISLSLCISSAVVKWTRKVQSLSNKFKLISSKSTH